MLKFKNNQKEGNNVDIFSLTHKQTRKSNNRKHLQKILNHDPIAVPVQGQYLNLQVVLPAKNELILLT